MWFFVSYTVSFVKFINKHRKVMQEASSPNRTLDLASALEIGPAGNKASNDYSAAVGCMRSVMTIAFEFAFESHLQEHVASMARQYVRSIISSVQRVALALSPSYSGSHAGLRTPLGTPEAQTLARWICQSYRYRNLPFISRMKLVPCNMFDIKLSWGFNLKRAIVKFEILTFGLGFLVPEFFFCGFRAEVN